MSCYKQCIWLDQDWGHSGGNTLLCPYLGRGEYDDDDWKQKQGNHQPLSYSDVKKKIKNPKSHRRQTTRLFYKHNWGLTRYQCVLQARQDWSSIPELQAAIPEPCLLGHACFASCLHKIRYAKSPLYFFRSLILKTVHVENIRPAITLITSFSFSISIGLCFKEAIIGGWVDWLPFVGSKTTRQPSSTNAIQ